MSELRPGRIPLTDEEAAAIAKLEAEHGPCEGLTRRDPGESGPVLVTIAGEVYEVG